MYHLKKDENVIHFLFQVDFVSEFIFFSKTVGDLLMQLHNYMFSYAIHTDHVRYNFLSYYMKSQRYILNVWAKWVLGYI